MHFKNFHEIKILLLLGSFIVYFLKYLLRNPCSLDNNFTIIKILFVNTTPRSKLQLNKISLEKDISLTYITTNKTSNV